MLTVRRFLRATLVALIAVFAGPHLLAPAHAEMPSMPVVNYGHNSHLPAAHLTDITTERGPPTCNCALIAANVAVDRGARGDSARLHTAAPPATQAHDRSGPLLQVVSSTATTLEEVRRPDGAPSSLVPSGVAANSVRPAVTDARLGRALADDFRGGPNPIGDGSALDAARHTVNTGELVGGSTHLEKAVEMRDRYARVLRRGGLSPADQTVAQGRYDAYSSFVIENDLDAMMRARGLR